MGGFGNCFSLALTRDFAMFWGVVRQSRGLVVSFFSRLFCFRISLTAFVFRLGV